MDRPILFSAPMVRALLAGTKTQTRRVLKLPTKGIYERKDMGGWAPTINGGGGSFTIGRDGTRVPAPETVGIWHQTTGRCLNAPYQIGDRLWVRETFCDPEDDRRPVYRADLTPEQGRESERVTAIWSRAERDRSAVETRHPHAALAHHPDPGFKWNGVGYHAGTMSDWGKCYHTPNNDGRCSCAVAGPSPAQCAYRELWNHINAARRFGWDANPWVIAVAFAVEKGNIDQPAKAAA
jgi:hypothetical protein